MPVCQFSILLMKRICPVNKLLNNIRIRYLVILIWRCKFEIVFFIYFVRNWIFVGDFKYEKALGNFYSQQ